MSIAKHIISLCILELIVSGTIIMNKFNQKQAGRPVKRPAQEIKGVQPGTDVFYLNIFGHAWTYLFYLMMSDTFYQGT